MDSLCSAEGARLGRSVQFSDTGLYPAQADHAKHLDAAALGVPVIAAGIPTLMDSDEGADLVVTPRALDSVIAHGSALLAGAINRALQPRLSVRSCSGWRGNTGGPEGRLFYAQQSTAARPGAGAYRAVSGSGCSVCRTVYLCPHGGTDAGCGHYCTAANGRNSFLAGAAVRTGAARIICAGGSSTGQHTGSGGILSATGRAGADGNIEDYLVPLLGEEARPADAGAVIEKNYPQGSGEKYIPCGAGSIKNNTRQTAADIAAEIENPLPFAIEPNSPDPQVLVMHTHATEDYRLSAGLWFAPGDGARSTDCSVNMCAVGRVVADTLNAAGINTLHDETLNDYPSYTGSYANSRAVVQQYLARYPSIKVVLDVHRDAIETESGSRYAPVCTVDGRQAAQVMIICGCDNGTTVRLPGWRQNLRFAAAWERSMEGMYPGFTRPVLFSYRFYNQDLTTGSLLIEIGGHGNNLNEALYAGQLAAKGLAAALLGGA